ncbi:MAG: hypothetical protein ABW321_05275, partial [Polyangiales bacterium]
MTKLEPLRSQHVPAVAALHAQALAGDFLPSLGPRFLEVLYRGMLELDLAHGVVALDDGVLAGFVIGTDDSSGLFRKLLVQRTLPLALQVARALLRRPRLLFPTLETFLYPSKEQLPGVDSELLVIAVSERQRSSGVGAALVSRLEADFTARGRAAYKLTVLAQNTR